MPKKPKGFGKFDNLMRKLVKVPPAEVLIHWRHATGGAAACGEQAPAKFVSNDAMLGVNCPACLKVFRRNAGGGPLR